MPLTSLSQENSLTIPGTRSPYFVVLRPICPATIPVPQATVAIYLDDGIGNPMGASTSLSAADTSTNIATGAFRPSSVLAIGARAPSPVLDLPNLPKVIPWSPTVTNVIATPHSVTVRGVEDKCSGDASFSLQVTSPRGGAAAARILYEGEARTVGRGVFDVRYRDPVSFSATPNGSLRVDVAGQAWVSPAGSTSTATSVSVGCGNNGSYTATTTTSGRCTYTAAGTVTLSYTITAGGASYSGSATAIVSP